MNSKKLNSLERRPTLHFVDTFALIPSSSFNKAAD